MAVWFVCILAAFCKNSVDGGWQEFDDRRVRGLATDQVVSKSAYILFYQRRSLSKFINQRLHTGNHWVFSLESLIKPKSTSPQRRNSGGSPVKSYGYSDDLRQPSTPAFIGGRPFSKEWNGPSSPTKRPTSRPLTPQPQRRQPSFEIDNYDQSPTVVKPKPSFRPTRPTLSRQLSDASVRAKRQLAHEPGLADRPTDKGAESGYGSGQSSRQIQPQALQVQLPPKASPDVMGTDVPKGRASDILLPQQVQLPLEQRETGKDRRMTQQQKPVPAPKGLDQGRATSQPASRSGSSISYHSQPQPPSVDVRVVDSPSFHSYPDHVGGMRAPTEPVSIPNRSGRPWQYESQSSQSSHDTQSSHDSHSSQQQQHTVTKTSPFSNGQEMFDWRQPEASAGADLTMRNSPSSGSGSGTPTSSSSVRVLSSKPPIPPKTITGRNADNWRKSDGGRAANNSNGTNVTLRPVSGTSSSSLTSPPSPAPRDSVRDIQRRISQREMQQSEGERRSAPVARELPRDALQMERPNDRTGLREGQFDQLRNKVSVLTGESVLIAVWYIFSKILIALLY